ncbi:hypothetical protein SH580_15030 [Coraliomargarita algicola]|uniref:Uncharacterized protein n=1 Tax=Coraliomargarita algicola TaxID=3092156 RepID=A0ABZ0RIX4_9BACT|nr:hypothetical protein [Coraliomargarita sp. J2-16]WPJ94745.1 hypothetical protein SH580_15030 [Coraliomargarita sp. J2-16]
MAELTNLTDRLAHLRDRKGSSPAITGNEPERHTPKKPSKARSKLPERRFANDYFMYFVYALLGIAMLTQFAVIAALDILDIL